MYIGIVMLEQVCVSVKENLNARAYKDIVDICVLPSLWQQLEEGTHTAVCVTVKCPHTFGHLV